VDISWHAKKDAIFIHAVVTLPERAIRALDLPSTGNLDVHLIGMDFIVT